MASSVKTLYQTLVYFLEANLTTEEPDAERSSRQGCDPAGERPVMTIAHVGHVVTPHLVSGNLTGDAWCERPGRLADTEPLWWEQSEGQAKCRSPKVNE